MSLTAFRSRSLPACLVLALALLGLLAATGAGADQTTKRVAKKATSTELGRIHLTTIKGRTLYSLSAERNGRFVCTGGCLQIWHPLFVGNEVKPTGPVKLGTIERPSGRTQVTYKGRPLYTFSGDAKPGDVNGEGTEDVGTWHVATVSRIQTPPPTPEPPPYPYPYPEPTPSPSPYPY
jgi:predicted lipoprotein with Yx(FWY)xxD motif